MKRGRFWQARRVFITGHGGFLGAWTVRELRARGAVTIGLLRDAVRPLGTAEDADVIPDITVHGALEDYDSVLRAINEHEADTVLHLGAQPIVGVGQRDPRSTFESNIRGTWNVLEACRVLPSLVRRIVVASSDKAYGTATQLPYTEDMPLNGRHPYDASKSCTDIIAQTYHHSYGLPVCVTRAGNFFGGRDMNLTRIVPSTICAALRGENPVLRSDGSLVRDYIYVRDVVQAYLLLAERMEDPALHGHAFNISNETPLDVSRLVERILSLAGRPDLTPRVLGTATAEIAAQYLSAAKARTMLGWSASWGLDDGLRETIAWYAGWLGIPPPNG